MNKFILKVSTLILLLSSTANAWDCKQLEAQFFGKITEARTDWADQGVVDCYIRIEFTQLMPNILCPLDIGPASSSDIYTVSDRCEGNFEVGQDISGYLVQTPDGRLYLDL